MKIEHLLFPSVIFKMTDHFVGRSILLCSNDPIFGTNKNRILEFRSYERDPATAKMGSEPALALMKQAE